MVKDLMLKIIFIPLLGICLPFIAEIISYKNYSLTGLILANVFFICTSFAIWIGCNWIHSKLRPLYKPIANPFAKTLAVCAVSALYAACMGGLSAFTWFEISREVFNWSSLFRFIAACIAAVIIFTLLYEIMFLNKEREIDTKIVDQLDRERSQAELQALTNELDPHFIFNSLNTLNYLITHNAEQAYTFNNRLAMVYKYFLINRNKELIPLQKELDFIADYFYLLQIRHDNKLQLDIAINERSGPVMIPPCALQILVENAIKHNEFTDQHPLQITIYVNDTYLKVTNNTSPKPYAVNSTGIGLKNLRARYKILFRKDIEIEKTRDHFTVKLPFIT